MLPKRNMIYRLLSKFKSAYLGVFPTQHDNLAFIAHANTVLRALQRTL